MPFEFNGKADLKDLKIHKGSSDDSQVTIVLRISFEGLPLGTAAAALGVEDPAP